MFEETNIIAGIEVGTSKICVLVGAVNADGGVNFIGLGQATSNGVRKGEIINPTVAEAELRHAVAEAEHMANVEIRRVILGCTGNHVRSLNTRGFHRVFGNDHEITPEDVINVVENARAVTLPTENTVIHGIRQFFLVDGEEGITDPVGMHGSRLEVDYHLLHGRTTRLQNGVRLVRDTSLVVEELVFNGLASALGVLTPEQKELGAVVIDLGAGVTEYVVYAEGIVRHTGLLAVGGDHVTNDLAYGLSLSLTRAEKLKTEQGAARVDEADRERWLSVADAAGREVMRVKAAHVQLIISHRVEELLRIIRDDLERSGLLSRLRAGVVLCGGGARLAGVATLAEQVFQKSVTMGRAYGITGMSQALDQPEFATAIGLVKYGALRERRPVERRAWWQKIKAMMAKLPFW